MRIRQQGEYKAFFTDSFKTIRLTNGIPMNPELEDVAINDKCNAGCSYCYTGALKSGSNFDDIILKAKLVYGDKDLNDRPFQIAIGGAGEPTMHPQFSKFVEYIKSIDIIPNYTTNGMHLTDEVLKATQEFCGGVALSWHPHIKKIFFNAVEKLKKLDIKLNVHIIIGSEESLQDLKELYNLYHDIFDYFVILPYQAVGRAKKLDTHKIWLETFNWINQVNSKKFAFGALFYNFLKSNNIPLKMSIYNPDIYSGYRMLNNNYKTLYKSSYELTEK